MAFIVFVILFVLLVRGLAPYLLSAAAEMSSFSPMAQLPTRHQARFRQH
jgi:hypothetical protein